MTTTISKDNFLKNISSKLGRPCPKHLEHFKRVNTIADTYLSKSSKNDLLTILKNKTKEIHTSLLCCSKMQLKNIVSDFIKNDNPKKIMLSTDEHFKDYGLEELDTQTKFKNIPVTHWSPNTNDKKLNITNASEADLAIVFGNYLLAESGSVVVESKPGQGRALHFLPKHYLAIVPLSKLLPRSTQLAKIYNQKIEKNEEIGSAINLISGPSNSGDIEMILVVGVHGPLQVSYILITDC